MARRSGFSFSTGALPVTRYEAKISKAVSKAIGQSTNKFGKVSHIKAASILKVTKSQARSLVDGYRRGSYSPRTGTVITFPDKSSFFVSGNKGQALKTFQSLYRRKKAEFRFEAPAVAKEKMKLYDSGLRAIRRYAGGEKPEKKIAAAVRLVQVNKNRLKPIGGDHSTLAGDFVPSGTRHYFDNKKRVARLRFS